MSASGVSSLTVLEESPRETKSAGLGQVPREALALLLLAAPLIAAQLAQISLGVIDNIMAGRLGEKALAAVALGSSVWFPCFAVTMGMCLAVTPMVAQSFGARREDEIGEHVWQGVWLAALVTLPAFLLARQSELILIWMKVPPVSIPVAVGYIQAISWGIPAIGLITVFRGWHEGIGLTWPIFVISLCAVPANVACNYCLMFGKLGLPALGAVGTGLASAIVAWLMALGLAVSMLCHPASRRHGVFEPRPIKLSEQWQLLKIGMPIGLGFLAETLMFGAVTVWVARFGTAPVAGHQVALNVASVTFMVPLGVAMAITVRVGQAIGRNDPHGARRAGMVGACLAALFMACAATVIFLIPTQIAQFYNKEGDVVRWAVTLLGVAAIFQISDGLQVCGASALRGLKDTRATLVITTIAYLGFALPMAWFFGIYLNLGPAALWTSLILGLTISAILLNSRFYWKTGRLLRDHTHVESNPIELSGLSRES